MLANNATSGNGSSARQRGQDVDHEAVVGCQVWHATLHALSWEAVNVDNDILQQLSCFSLTIQQEF